VTLEESACAVEFLPAEPDAVSVALDERESALTAYPIRRVVARDRGGHRDGPNRNDFQPALRGERRGGNERRLSRQRNTETLDRDEKKEYPVAVALDEMKDGRLN